MQRLKYFSGIKPTLEDLEFDQEGKESAILARQREMFSDGVLLGLQVIENSGVYSIQPGVAYVGGERIEVVSPVALTIASNQLPCFVVIKHRQDLSHGVPHFVTGAEHLIYQSDGFEVLVHTNDTAVMGELLLAELTTSGIFDRRVFLRLAVDNRIHAPNSDVGTSALEFRVGIGDPVNPEGLLVLTESPVPRPPLNVRITGILPDSSPTGSVPGTTTFSLNLGGTSGMAKVMFAWDYDDIIGEVVASDSFRIDNPGYTFAADRLRGYYLTFASSEEFLITGNEATSSGQTLLNVQGSMTGLSAILHPASIHAGATEYRITAIPIDVDGTTPIITNPSLPASLLSLLPALPAERIEGVVSHDSSMQGFGCMLRLVLGKYYAFQVKAIRRGSASPVKLMGAGSFPWRGQTVEYSYPFQVALPMLGEATLNLTPLPKATGFTAQVTGWQDADLLEYGWVRIDQVEYAAIDFANPDHHPAVTPLRTVKLQIVDDLLDQAANPIYATQILGFGNSIDTQRRLVAITRRYLFAVRPLIGGQVVGQTLSGRVTLESDPYFGQAQVVNTIQTLTRHLDLLNKTVQNLDAIRRAQSARIEDQLTTLNGAVQAGQQYDHFSLAEVNLPFPDIGSDIPLLGRDGVGDDLLFDLDPESTEQTFTHNLGNLNYMVQVRNADGVIVDADIDLNENNVVIRLAQPMAGSVIILER